MNHTPPLPSLSSPFRSQPQHQSPQVRTMDIAMHATQAAVCYALRRPAGLRTGEAQSSLAATMAKVVRTIRSVNVV